MDKVIQINFGSETNEQVLSVFIKSFNDAIMAARGNYKALLELNRLAKEAAWLTNEFVYEASQKNN